MFRLIEKLNYLRLRSRDLSRLRSEERSRRGLNRLLRSGLRSDRDDASLLGLLRRSTGDDLLRLPYNRSFLSFSRASSTKYGIFSRGRLVERRRFRAKSASWLVVVERLRLERSGLSAR